MKKKTRIYYLAHPLTTHGNINYNRNHEAYIAKKIQEQYPDATVIRPLTILSHYLNKKEAYDVCDRLMSVSDTLIFASDEWRQSKGCMHEYEQARKQNMQILQCIEKDNKMIFFEIVRWSGEASHD